MEDEHKKNMNRTHKIKELILDKLKGYVENIDFKMSYSNSNIVFYVEDVEVRTDLLKKIGLPLELSKGRIKLIKIIIQSITLQKPIEVEISGIDVDIRTIQVSRDYKKDYKNFRLKFLDEWEKRNKEFFSNLMQKETLIESILINKLIPIKVEIKDIRVVITDTVTSSPGEEKKIAISIFKILSYGIDEKNEQIFVLNEKDMTIKRIFKISRMNVNIFKGKFFRKIDNELIDPSNCFIHHFNFDVIMEVPKKNVKTYIKIPKVSLKVKFDTTVVIDLTVSRLKFLISFFNYLTKIKEVEKYWINRPDVKDEKFSINKSSAEDWFKYAFRIVKEEMRNKRRESNTLTSILERVVYMQKYINAYKQSNKLITAPWIKYTQYEEDLQEFENRMTLDDIIYCREIAFTELITEGKAFCSTGEIGQGYKPLIHIWEYYVNDLKSKWTNNDINNNKIDLTPTERTDLMMLANIDRDKVLLSYLKGEPNHQDDKMMSIIIDIPSIMINISKKIGNKEIQETTNTFQKIYSNNILQNLKNCNLLKYLKQIEQIPNIEENVRQEELEKECSSINNNLETIKDIFNDNVSSDSRISMSSSQNDNYSIHSKIINLQRNRKELTEINESKQYLDENDNSIKNENIDETYLNKNNRDYKEKLELKNDNNSKKLSSMRRKTVITVLINNIYLNLIEYRNSKIIIDIIIKIFHIIDHNMTYILLNERTKTGQKYMNELYSKVINDYYYNIYNNDDLYTDSNNYFKFSISKFLSDIVFNKTLDIIVTSNELDSDKKFIKEYLIANNFKEIDNKIDSYNVEDLYNRLVIPLLIDKNLLGDKIELDKNKKQNTKDKKTISKLFERFVNNSEYINFNYEKNNNDQSFKTLVQDNQEENLKERIKRAMIDDLNLVMKEISVNLASYLFSSLYMYHMEDKMIFKFFKTNIKECCESITKKKPTNFLIVKLQKEGRKFEQYIIKDIKEDDHKENSKSKEEISNDESNENKEKFNVLEYDDKRSNLINIKMEEDININLTNETIAEAMCIIFSIKRSDKKISYAKNILSDIRKSYLEIYDKFRSIKSKWKAMNYLKDNSTYKLDPRKVKEMIFLESRFKYLYDNIIKSKLLLNLNIYNFNINICDKLFYQKEEIVFYCSLIIKDVEISNNQLDKIPLNGVVILPENSRELDMDKIRQCMFKNDINIGQICLNLDHDNIINTNIKGNIIQSYVPDLTFMSDTIIDFYSSHLNLNISPSIIKLPKIISSTTYFMNFYMKYLKKPKKSNNIFEEEESEIYSNFINKFIKELNKLKKDKKDLLEYLRYRFHTVIYYSIGKFDINNSNKLNEYGIIIKFKENDKGLLNLMKELEKLKFFNKPSPNFDSFEDEENINNEKSNYSIIEEKEIFTIYIPLLIFNLKENLFFVEKKLWLSDILTIKDIKNNFKNNLKHDKLQVKFDSDNQMKFTSYELLFCYHFINCVEFMKHTKHEVKSIKNYKFKNENFPFDNDYIISPFIGLNNLFSQKSYRYENQLELKNFYESLFQPHINDSNLHNSDILSYLDLSIKEISFCIYITNTQLLEFFAGVKKYSELYDKLKVHEVNKQDEDNKNDHVYPIQKHLIPHRINLIVSLFKLEIFHKLENKENNPMLFFIIEHISFGENMNMKKSLDNIYLSSLFIQTIGLILSVPSYFRKEDNPQSRIQILKLSDIENIHKSMKNEKNQLLVLCIQNIQMEVFINRKVQLSFSVKDNFKFGFSDRTEDEIKIEDITYMKIDPIITIEKNKTELIQMSDEMRNKINDIFRNIKIEYDFNSLIDIKINNIDNLYKDESDLRLKLFGSFAKISLLINRILEIKDHYYICLKVNLIFIEIPSKIYHYIYYIKNYLEDINISLKNLIPQDNNSVNQISSFIKKYSIKQINKENLFEMVNLDIPYISLSLKQINNNLKIVFLNIGLFEIKGRLFIFPNISLVNHFKLEIYNVIWKPYSGKYENLFIKNNEFNGALATINIKLRKDIINEKEIEKKSINDNNDILEYYNFTKLNSSISVEIEELNFIFLNKIIKDIICFIEQNSECLKENPTLININDEKLKNEWVKNILVIKINKSSIIVPESSNSSNFIQINVEEAYIFLNESFRKPKIIIKPQNKIHIIDKKMIFNLKSQEAENLIPHTYLEIYGIDINAFFYINQEIDNLADISNLNIYVLSPKNDNQITQVTKYNWMKNTDDILIYKPSVSIEIKSGTLETNMGKLIGLKSFVDNNFEEPSDVLKDSNMDYSSIDLKLDIKSAVADLNIYKMNKDFIPNFAFIDKILPGDNKLNSFLSDKK